MTEILQDQIRYHVMKALTMLNFRSVTRPIIFDLIGKKSIISVVGIKTDKKPRRQRDWDHYNLVEFERKGLDRKPKWLGKEFTYPCVASDDLRHLSSENFSTFVKLRRS